MLSDDPNALPGHSVLPEPTLLFSGGKTEYDASTLQTLLGKKWQATSEHLLAVGFFSKNEKDGQAVYSIPFLYRHGMQLTQGRA